MNGWLAVLLCAVAYVLGFTTAAVLAAGRDDDGLDPDIKAGLTDD